MPPTSAPPSPATEPPLRLALFVALAAAIAICHSLLHVLGVFLGVDHIETSSVIAQVITSGKLIVAPVFAIAALYLALNVRVRGAIGALAALMFVTWLNELPRFSVVEVDLSIVVFGFYLIGSLMAAWLVLRGRPLWVAALLVGIPAIFGP